jgi:exodeoxyribonuclease-3
MRIATANVNGIRAAARKGGLAELADLGADFLLLQEVRASDEQLRDCLAVTDLADHAVAHDVSQQPGRNGVAIVGSAPLTIRREGLPGFVGAGRWIETDAAGADHDLRLVSVYVPSGGEVGSPGQDAKFGFLAAMTTRLAELLAENEAGGPEVLVGGDLNVARTPLDLKNWKGRIGLSGFLEEERAHLEEWESTGWVDLGRSLAGDGPGPYTWWSMRGRAFDNDAGWRIDYCWATPALAKTAVSASVLRAPSWDSRWSDHAALVVGFD